MAAIVSGQTSVSGQILMVKGHGYLMELRDGSKMYFNQYSPNQLEWSLDRFGNRVDYVYDAGLVSRIVSANGRYLAITYDSDNRISTIRVAYEDEAHFSRTFDHSFWLLSIWNSSRESRL